VVFYFVFGHGAILSFQLPDKLLNSFGFGFGLVLVLVGVRVSVSGLLCTRGLCGDAAASCANG